MIARPTTRDTDTAAETQERRGEERRGDVKYILSSAGAATTLAEVRGISCTEYSVLELHVGTPVACAEMRERRERCKQQAYSVSLKPEGIRERGLASCVDTKAEEKAEKKSYAKKKPASYSDEKGTSVLQ